MTSTGRTGATGHIPLEKVNSSDVVKFDAVQTIARNYAKLAHEYEVVCVNWDSEHAERVEALQETIPEGDFLLARDNTRGLPAKGVVLAGNNKYRQVFSTALGFRLLAERGCDLVLKIRSDQEFDVKTAIDALKDDLSDPNIKLMVPWFDPINPTGIPDFFFGGRTSEILGALDYYLMAPERFESVHSDLFAAFGTYLRESKPRRIAPPAHLMRSSVVRSWVINTWKMISIPPEGVFESYLWRGEQFSPGRGLMREGLAVGVTPTADDFAADAFLSFGDLVSKGFRNGGRRVSHRLRRLSS